MTVSIRTRRKVCVVTGVVASGLIVLTFTCAFIQIIRFRQKLRAELLLNEVRSLEVGQSSGIDIGRIVADYKGWEAQISGLACDPHGPSYMVTISNKLLNDLVLSHPTFRYLLHPRRVRAIFILKNQRLCYVEYSVEAEPYNSLPVRRKVSVTLASETQHVPFDVGFIGGNIPAFRAALTSEATPEQHKNAFDFNLSCLTSFSACREACEVMPFAWLDYQNKAHREGLTLPPDELNDSHCPKLSNW
jgi:hypothetical protein